MYKTILESYHFIDCFHPLLSVFIAANSAHSDQALVRDLTVCMALLGIFCINALTLVYSIFNFRQRVPYAIDDPNENTEHNDCSTIF